MCYNSKARSTRIRFEFMRFNLTENASKLFRQHERFCLLFACLHDNTENNGIVNQIMSDHLKSLTSIVVFMLEN